MGDLGLNSWQLTLELKPGPGRLADGLLRAPWNELAVFAHQNPGNIQLSRFSHRLSGDVLIPNLNTPSGSCIVLASGTIAVDGKDLRAGQAVVVDSDGRLDLHD